MPEHTAVAVICDPAPAKRFTVGCIGSLISMEKVPGIAPCTMTTSLKLSGPLRVTIMVVAPGQNILTLGFSSARYCDFPNVIDGYANTVIVAVNCEPPQVAVAVICCPAPAKLDTEN